MKNTKLMAAIPMVATIIMPMTAFAATGYETSSDNVTYSDEINDDAATNTVDVTTTQASTFSVTIPKTIILNGTKGDINQATYKVSASGNYASDEVINVVPTTSFKMKDSKGLKSELTATVSQPITKFVNAVTKDNHTTTKNDTTATKETSTTGTVTVDGLTAGTWNGQFNFNISLEKIAQ